MITDDHISEFLNTLGAAPGDTEEMTVVNVYKKGEETSVRVISRIWRKYYSLAASTTPGSQQILLKMDGKKYDGYDIIIKMMYLPSAPSPTFNDISWSIASELTPARLCISSWIEQYIAPEHRNTSMNQFIRAMARLVYVSSAMFNRMVGKWTRDIKEVCKDTADFGPYGSGGGMSEYALQLMSLRDSDYKNSLMFKAPLKETTYEHLGLTRIWLIMFKPKLLSIDAGPEAIAEVERLWTIVPNQTMSYAFETSRYGNFYIDLYRDVLAEGICAIKLNPSTYAVDVKNNQ